MRIFQDLELTKAHHIVLSYERQLAPGTRLQVEGYYQYLTNVGLNYLKLVVNLAL